MRTMFKRSDLEVTGAILRCQGQVRCLTTGRVIDFDGQSLDDVLFELDQLANDVYGLGWKFEGCTRLIPIDEMIRVQGESGEYVTFIGLAAVKELRTWAGGGDSKSYWERKRQLWSAEKQRRNRQGMAYNGQRA